MRITFHKPPVITQAQDTRRSPSDRTSPPPSTPFEVIISTPTSTRKKRNTCLATGQKMFQAKKFKTGQ
jgi:hypothetical protein